MNGIKTEDMGSRKKYLAPLAVLIVCMLSLTGAAYAYSSTLTNTGNTVDADFLSIDLKQDNGAVAGDAFVLANDRSIVKFTDNFGYTAGANKTNQIGFELADDKLVVTYKVTITREAGNTGVVNLVVSTADLMSQSMFTVAGTAKTMGELFDVKVALDSGAAQTLVNDSGTYKYTFENTALGEHTIAVTFDGKVANGYTTADRFNMTDETPAIKTASGWQSAIGTKSFGLTFEAVSA